MANENNVIKISRIKLINFKNVKNGEIFLNNKDADNTTVNVLGIYGQNGSGKSAFVEAMNIIDLLLKGLSLPKNTNDLIYFGEDKSAIEIDFIYYSKITDKTYIVYYSVELNNLINFTKTGFNEEPNDILINNETIKYKLFGKGNWSSTIISYNYKKLIDIFSPATMYSSLIYNQDNTLNALMARRISIGETKSFIFNSEMFKIYDLVCDDMRSNKIPFNLELAEKLNCLTELHDYALNKLNILNEKTVNLASQLPLIVDFKKDSLSIELLRSLKIQDKLVPKERVIELIQTYEHINTVLNTIIPDLTITIKELSKLTDEKGQELLEIETYVNRGKLSIPFKYESQGIRKIISLLGYLVHVYNDESACVVIDELDSAIFEYLLGELLIVFKENAKGQLIFTSHNLRALEVLDSNSVVFTTTNPENRYIKFKNIKKDNNLRDKYYSTIQLGGQDEEVYLSQKTHVIRRAFRKAGDLNG